jgi:putative addiction module component (TIGR02574 family)
MNQQALISQFQNLPADERAELLEKLMRAHSEAQQGTELTGAELSELDARMSAYDADPSTGIDADDLHRRLRARLVEA